jgi:tRNA modification GTPase
MAALLDACLAAGCVLAHPGEFTYRAHCNGKVDLAQAESVAALIGARTQAAARVALGQLRGGLRTAIEPLSAELLQLCAALEASLDFPEDDIDQEAWAQLESLASHLAHELFLLARGYGLGKRLFHGARVALIGPVNAGKSSLLNALCGETRAIVDDEPGTTRDIVRATFDCGGIPVELLDTAGLRDEPGRIEQVGIERTKDAATTADLVVIVIDGSGETALDTAYFEQLQGATDAPIILAVNKADLPGYDLAGPLPSFKEPRLAVSAHTTQGLDEMRQTLSRLLRASESSSEPPVVGTARQHEILCLAQGHVAAAAQLLTQGAEPELAGSELFRARKALTGLLGGDATEDLLEQIFSSFCIGK